MHFDRHVRMESNFSESTRFPGLIAVDTNMLVYAHRREVADTTMSCCVDQYLQALETEGNDTAAIGAGDCCYRQFLSGS